MSLYTANQQISTKPLDCLLEEFGEHVNSKRIRSRINTISDLMNVLYKRNVFYTEKNALKTISKYITSEEQQNELYCHLNSSCHIENDQNSGNIYAKIRQQFLDDLNSTAVRICANSDSNQSFPINLRVAPKNLNQNCESRRRHELFQFICNNVDNWRDFGRCMDMKDVELNCIDQELRNDIKLITNRILERTENRFGEQFHKKLCEALAEARRKDICRELKKLKLINE